MVLDLHSVSVRIQLIAFQQRRFWHPNLFRVAEFIAVIVEVGQAPQLVRNVPLNERKPQVGASVGEKEVPLN